MEEKIDLTEMKIDRIFTLDKEYSFFSEEVYTQWVEIMTPAVVRQKAKSIKITAIRENAMIDRR